MELHKLHVRDRRAGPPRHGHAVAGRDVGIRCVEINLSATAGREHDSIRANRFYFACFFIQNINAKATILRRETKLGRSDQIDGHVVLKKIDPRLACQLLQQSVLDLLPATLRMTGFAAKIELAMSVDLALVELQPEIDQLADSRWPFRHNRPHHRFIAKSRARLERVAHMQLKRIFIARHAGDTALRPCRVRVDAFPLRHHRHRSMFRRFERKR